MSKVVSSTPKTTRRVAALLSFGIQLFALSLLVLLPMLFTQALPRLLFRSLLAPTALTSAQMGHPEEARSSNRSQSELISRTVLEPRRIPRTISMLTDDVAPPALMEGADNRSGIPGGPGMPGILDAIPGVSPVPPPAVSIPKGPTRISQGVLEGHLLRRMQPAYPSLDRSARIQGAVVLGAVISREGSIEGLHVISGHPMLASAAIDAVRQWRYRPYLLNGAPVEVETQITVVFSLTGN